MRLARIVDLANQLESQIASGGLRPGDFLPGTDEIARNLGVSTSAANGALRVLVKRGLVHRRQRRGTVIAQLPGQQQRSALHRVHVVVHKRYLEMEGLLSDGLLIGLQGELPGAEMQFSFIPPTEEPEYADRLIAEVLRSREAEGFVLVRAPLPVQRAVETSGLPAVVFGTLQPSVQGLASIERDQIAIADVLLEHLLDRGCRRLVTLFRTELGPGDFTFLDRVQKNLAKAGRGLADLVIRCLAADREALRHSLAPLLEKPRRPTGFLCRNQPLADAVAAAAESMRLKVGRDLHIAVSDIYRKPADPAPQFPYARSALGSEEIGHRLGRLLVAQARGDRPDPKPELIPIVLEIPATGRA